MFSFANKILAGNIKKINNIRNNFLKFNFAMIIL